MRTQSKSLGNCQLCQKSITDPSDYRYGALDIEFLMELRGEEPTGKVSSRSGHLHLSCLKKLDIPSQRRLIQRDFSIKILNVENEIWVRLDKYGRILWETLASDIPEIDSKIQEMKNRVLTVKDEKLTEEEKKWLEDLLSYS